MFLVLWKSFVRRTYVINKSRFYFLLLFNRCFYTCTSKDLIAANAGRNVNDSIRIEDKISSLLGWTSHCFFARIFLGKTQTLGVDAENGMYIFCWCKRLVCLRVFSANAFFFYTRTRLIHIKRFSWDCCKCDWEFQLS